jgi:hypothetical protein
LSRIFCRIVQEFGLNIERITSLRKGFNIYETGQWKKKSNCKFSKVGVSLTFEKWIMAIGVTTAIAIKAIVAIIKVIPILRDKNFINLFLFLFLSTFLSMYSP